MDFNAKLPRPQAIRSFGLAVLELNSVYTPIVVNLEVEEVSQAVRPDFYMQFFYLESLNDVR